MRVLVLLSALCFALPSLINTFGFGSHEIGLVETARAQTVPKALEEGGSDAAMKLRKNNWTVGVAGGQLSGTYITFPTSWRRSSTTATICGSFRSSPTAPLPISMICCICAMSMSR